MASCVRYLVEQVVNAVLASIPAAVNPVVPASVITDTRYNLQ